MTAKAYLGQARFLDMRIKSKVQQIESLNDLATSCTAAISDMPRNPNKGRSRVEDCVMKILELQESLQTDIERLVELKKEIMTTVRAVEDVELQALLEKRYLCFLSWEKIAVDIRYPHKHTVFGHKHTIPEHRMLMPVRERFLCGAKGEKVRHAHTMIPRKRPEIRALSQKSHNPNFVSKLGL